MNALKLVVLISLIGSLHLQKSNGLAVPTWSVGLVEKLHVVSKRTFVPSLPSLPQTVPQVVISCAEVIRYGDGACTDQDCYEECDDLDIASGLEECTENRYYCCCDLRVHRLRDFQPVPADSPTDSESTDGQMSTGDSSESSMEGSPSTDDSYSTNDSMSTSSSGGGSSESSEDETMQDPSDHANGSSHTNN